MSRNGFNDCEREYNRREEAIEMAKEERREAMSDSPRTDEVWRSMHGSGYQMMLLAQKLERELAEGKNKYLQVCAQHGRLVDQVFEEDGETLKHIAAEAELADYKLWAEVEIADLRDDVKRHIEIASFNAAESLKWRNLFQNERDHHQEANDLLRECRAMLDGLEAQPLIYRIDAAMGKRDAAADKYRKDNPLGGPANMFDAIASRIRLGEEYYAVLADFDVTVGALNQAESRAAALEEALSQMLDDMGADGFCVCPAAKEQAIAAMGRRDDT
jgi:hypothetical protein